MLLKEASIQLGDRQSKQAASMPLKRAKKWLKSKGKLTYHGTDIYSADVIRKGPQDRENFKYRPSPGLHSGTATAAIQRASERAKKAIKLSPASSGVVKSKNPRWPILHMVHPEPSLGGRRGKNIQVPDYTANDPKVVRDDPPTKGPSWSTSFTSHGSPEMSRVAKTVRRKGLSPKVIDDYKVRKEQEILKMANSMYGSYVDNSPANATSPAEYTKFLKARELRDARLKQLDKSAERSIEASKTYPRVSLLPYRNSYEDAGSTSFVSRTPGGSQEVSGFLRKHRTSDVMDKRKRIADHIRKLRSLPPSPARAKELKRVRG